MSNTDNTNTSHCDQCAVPLTESNHGFFAWRDRCDRCHSRLELDDKLLEIAHIANQFYKSDDQVIDLQHQLAERRLRVHELKRPVEASDSRVAHLWDKLWDALSGDIEQDETWGMFMDALPGLPDLRTKTWEVEIPLDSITVEVEAKDEDEAIELAKEKAEGDYCLSDVFQEQYIEAREI